MPRASAAARVPVALSRARFPEAVLGVLRTLDAASRRSWIVGGVVRDILLGRARHDTEYDLATPATPEEVTSLFDKVIPTGIEHGTVTVLVGREKLEVTTFRGEGPYLDGRRPESVTFHGDVGVDLARRDFTMNALAYDPLAPEFRDPFHGRADMRRRLIRAVGDPAARFGEDGLRPLRAVRFAAQLGYELHRATRAAIPGALPVVAKVSTERIAEELSKLAVAPHAGRGVELLRATGLLGSLLPALAALSPPALRHAVRTMARVRAEPALRFAALLHPLAPAKVEQILVDLRLPRRVAEEARALVEAHSCARSPRPLPEEPAEVRRWLAAAGPARAPALLDLAAADAGDLPARRARRRLAEVRRLAALAEEARLAGAPLSAQDLALDGRGVMDILGVGPGPHVGEALRHLLDQVLTDPALNERERLAEAVRRWWAKRL